MYFVHVLWNKYFGNFQVLILFAYNEYHSLMFAVWCVFGLFRNVSLFFLVCPWALFLYVFTSSWNLFYCLVHISQYFFFLYHISSSFLGCFTYIFEGGVLGLCDQHAVFACMSFYLLTAVDQFPWNFIWILC
jgi:hypothetical protein